MTRWSRQFSRTVRCAGVCIAPLLALLSRHAHAADSVAVPLPLETELLARVAPEDANFKTRASGVVRILIVTNPDSGASARSGAQAEHLFDDIPTIGGLPHEETVVPFTNAATLAQLCKSKSISIVFLMPGLDDKIAAISQAIGNLSLLTVGSTASYVSQGIVLGFDMVSGKPKLLIQPNQARRQNVAFNSDILALMKKVTP